MSRGRFVWDDKLGHFVEGKASPELLPEHMRGLPGEWVTKDIAENDKIHELDPPHIVEDQIASRIEKLKKEEKKPLEGALLDLQSAIVPVGVKVPLSQLRIDLVRFRILRARLHRLVQQKCNDLSQVKVDYVWFPENNVNKYELRASIPARRPAHLRHYKLELDITAWPESILAALAQLGININVEDMLNEARRKADAVEEVRREEDLLRESGSDN